MRTQSKNNSVQSLREGIRLTYSSSSFGKFSSLRPSCGATSYTLLPTRHKLRLMEGLLSIPHQGGFIPLTSCRAQISHIGETSYSLLVGIKWGIDKRRITTLSEKKPHPFELTFGMEETQHLYRGSTLMLRIVTYFHQYIQISVWLISYIFINLSGNYSLAMLQSERNSQVAFIKIYYIKGKGLGAQAV